MAAQEMDVSHCFGDVALTVPVLVLNRFWAVSGPHSPCLCLSAIIPAAGAGWCWTVDVLLARVHGIIACTIAVLSSDC